jgi:hypothetical protein
MGKISTIWLNKALLLAFTCVALCPVTVSSASAQTFMKGRKEDLPDASGFYMSRRQYQIIDDGPVVRNSQGQVVPANQAGFTSNVGAGRAPLQRAGFMPYSSGHLKQQNLPKVNNGADPGQRLSLAAAFLLPSAPVLTLQKAPKRGGKGGGR